MRPENRSRSAPPSNSVERSGSSLGLPTPPTVTPTASAPVASVTPTGSKNGMASVEPGWRPVRPQAARNLSDDKNDNWGKNDSSLSTHEPLSFG